MLALIIELADFLECRAMSLQQGLVRVINELVNLDVLILVKLTTMGIRKALVVHLIRWVPKHRRVSSLCLEHGLGSGCSVGAWHLVER